MIVITCIIIDIIFFILVSSRLFSSLLFSFGVAACSDDWGDGHVEFLEYYFLVIGSLALVSQSADPPQPYQPRMLGFWDSITLV